VYVDVLPSCVESPPGVGSRDPQIDPDQPSGMGPHQQLPSSVMGIHRTRRTATHSTATVPRKTRADRGSPSCVANGSTLDGSSHFPHPGHPWPARCGNQGNGALTRHRDLPRPLLHATTQTSRDDHATLEPQPSGGPTRLISLT